MNAAKTEIRECLALPAPPLPEMRPRTPATHARIKEPPCLTPFTVLSAGMSHLEASHATHRIPALNS